MGRPLNTDGRDTREGILDAALDVFSEKGFHGASLKEIAAVVGVRDSALYHYFASKEDLLDAVLAERTGTPESRDHIARLAKEPITDARAVLTDIAETIVDLVESPRAQKLFRVLMSDGLRLHAEKRVNLLRYFDGRQLYASVLDRMIRAKMLRSEQPELLAVSFLAPFLSLMMLRMIQPDHPFTKDRAAFIRAHVDQFLCGASSKR